MLRIWSRRISLSWHREFRRQGHEVMNSFVLHFQAKEKKHRIKKMKKELGEYNKPKKPRVIVKSMEDIPNIEYVREKVRQAIEKVEKVHGPLKFKITKSPDDNPYNAKVEINEKGYKALFLELMKDPKEVPKIAQVLQASLYLKAKLEQEELKEAEKVKDKEEDKTKDENRIITDVYAELSPAAKKRVDICVGEMEKELFSSDLRRIDIGLIISRPPIFYQ